MKISQETAQTLKQWKVVWSDYFLPDVKLDRKEYLLCNDVLEAIGLKWNKKEKCHKWEEDIGDTLFEILDTGEVETLKEYRDKFQFFPTPDSVADYLVECADLQDDDGVLEPSFWDGALLFAIQRTKKHFPLIVWVELDTKRFNEFVECKSKIENSTLNRYGKFRNIDFLDMTDELCFSKIVMNPPFSKSQDVKHILKAYSLLQKWGTLVSIASSSIQHRTGSLYEEIADLNPEYIELPEWSFKESGTMVNSVIVKITK